jgi:hypothetical protein
MPATLPEAVIHADRVHHDILERVSFSRYLNPQNANEARRAFLKGAEAPPFSYLPFEVGDSILAALERAEPPRDHPAGELLGRRFAATRLLVRALQERSAEAFDAMADASGWYPEPELLTLRFPEPKADPEPLDVPAHLVVARLEQALHERGLTDWRVVNDTVMSARVLVDGAKRLLRVNPEAHFRQRDLARLVVHEVDVHALRAANGQRQQLRIFETGLPGCLATEEGLAMLSEEQAGVASPGVLRRQVEVCLAIDQARQMGFRQLYDTLLARLGAGLAWGICLRIKRGLSHPEHPGVYAKDSVYLQGRMQVHAWLEAGGDARKLYIGKVSVDDPVDAWIAQGWVTKSDMPPSWAPPITLTAK